MWEMFLAKKKFLSEKHIDGEGQGEVCKGSLPPSCALRM